MYYVVLTYVELGENHHEKCSYSMMECTQINASMYFGCTMVLIVELVADELQNLKSKWNDDILKEINTYFESLLTLLTQFSLRIITT